MCMSTIFYLFLYHLFGNEGDNCYLCGEISKMTKKIVNVSRVKRYYILMD